MTTSNEESLARTPGFSFAQNFVLWLRKKVANPRGSAMLRLALLIVLWLVPAEAGAQPFTSAFIPSPTGRPMEVPTVFFFQQLRMACQATVRDPEEELECTSRAKYLRITASRMNRRIAAAYYFRYLQMYDDLREVWRKIMDDNSKLATSARLLLEKYPQVRAFVRSVPAHKV